MGKLEELEQQLQDVSIALGERYAELVQDGIYPPNDEYYQAIKKDEKEIKNAYELEKSYQRLTDDYENADLEIRLKYNDLKARNLRLAEFYKVFNPVVEVPGQTTKFGKDKIVYKLISKLEKKELPPINRVSAEKIARCEMCSTHFTAISDVTLTKSKIVKTLRCHDRYCPICAKYKSIKNALSIQTIYNYLKDTTKYEYLLLTLTVPNVTEEELKEAIEHYYVSIKEFFKYKRIKKINKGYICKFEITRNEEHNTYHPHVHILLVVPNQYFKNSDLYILHNEWLKYWQKAARNNLITQVDIRKVKNKNSNGISSEILELVKYMAKDSDYLIDTDIFKIFYNSLYRKRSLRFGGIFREAVNQFKKGELNKYIPRDTTAWYFIIKYGYNFETSAFDRKGKIVEMTLEQKIALIENEIKDLPKEFDINY